MPTRNSELKRNVDKIVSNRGKSLVSSMAQKARREQETANDLYQQMRERRRKEVNPNIPGLSAKQVGVKMQERKVQSKQARELLQKTEQRKAVRQTPSEINTEKRRRVSESKTALRKAFQRATK